MTERTVLQANFEADDHDSAALLVRPDGRYLAMYSRHNTDAYSRWRIADENGWGPEQTFDHGTPTTYSNVYPWAPHRTGRLYGFVRSVGRDPHILVSDDNGSTWSNGGRLLDGPGRPYVRYSRAGRIHLITTEQRPDEYATGIYHGVIVDGRLLRSDGSVVDDDLSDHSAGPPTSSPKCSPAMPRTGHGPSTCTSTNTAARTRCSRCAHPDRTAYYYARLDDARWHVHLLAHAGSELYPSEPSYTGLAALDGNDAPAGAQGGSLRCARAGARAHRDR